MQMTLFNSNSDNTNRFRRSPGVRINESLLQWLPTWGPWAVVGGPQDLKIVLRSMGGCPQNGKDLR